MRIADSQLQSTVLNGLYQRVNDLMSSQQELSSGLRINKPSDDPAGSVRVSALKTVISKLDQYSKNMDSVSSNMKMADSVLMGAHNLLNRAKQLALQESTGTSTANTRTATAQEVDEIFQQLVQIGNTSQGGRYIFAGYQNSTPPFDASGNYVSDSNTVQEEIGAQYFAQSNIPGGSIFNPAGGVDVFKSIQDLSTALKANDTAGIGAAMDNISTSFSQVEASQAQVGAIENQITDSQSRLQDDQVNMKTLLSNSEDADLVTAISDFQTKSAALTAARQAASKLFQDSLLDYLK